MCKANVLTCIAPKPGLRQNPSPSRFTLLDFSKCYRMCVNGGDHTSEIALPYLSTYISEEMMCCGSKNDFFQKIKKFTF
jgi:hypothetical protein